MAKVYLNKEVELNREKIWMARNGATRRNLVLINKLKKEGKRKKLLSKVGFFEKGKHSFIFLNPSNKQDKIIGIFLNSKYGYSLKRGDMIFEASSIGGYGNS
jgi:hypothetical protein